MTSLWTLTDMARAMRAETVGAPAAEITGISIDTRTIAKGEAFFALTDVRDGHDFVEAALKGGATVAVVARSKRDRFPADAPLLVVDDVLDGLRDLARAARARMSAKVIAVTGSVGKTGTKEALRLALSADGETHASVASYNNHWGVPLSLARCPADVKYAVFEIGMNHAGEITPLTKLVRPHVAIVTTVEAVHLEYFGSIEKIADAKAEIFLGLEPGGAAVINRDNSQYERLAAAAKAAGVKNIVRFGEDPSCEARLIRFALHAGMSSVHADILGHEVHYKLGAPGRHLVNNSLAVLAAASLAGADLALAALALGKLRAPAGRGARFALHIDGGNALLIDESYNANPASMAAAIALLGQAEVGKLPNGSCGRRIAVLGDMLELGSDGEKLHRALAADLEAARIDLVYCSGPLMRSLFQALPSDRRGGYAGTAAELEPAVLGAVRPGDAVMVKGSFGSKMAPIVKALVKTYAGTPAPEADAGT
ncbi:UDP-N-acetylmuramoylalanyl-D-glutamyl-2,6-diaminopimelate--D-alanyl-D-alanine ligase [Pseudolabrys sp. FHR47]|uniref:UDP-N-acetylmuramoylalanyl-D-glutamyl-2, 6-diaminopimelate--D-alanyl-D-alanine ligase n=1 Tax=Pseudolabrys sp. FHR47 TaxID=2562284 RepID=UPI0010BF6617|nr:UDP-N-acetylmuramoylalanyl-D-glutamyl-2,6-diaminopimelate--D-alanyl-D-alanine ligase [Pseudolabrys sp. FHR47]